MAALVRLAIHADCHATFAHAASCGSRAAHALRIGPWLNGLARAGGVVHDVHVPNRMADQR
jgi:hypothetical protein